VSKVHFTEAVKPLLVPIGSVRDWPDNPRSGDLSALIESITKNGFYQAVVVQRSTGYVIAGNHRKAALEQMGATEIPVLFVDASDEEATRLALADNRTSDLAFYDDPQLFKLLDQLVNEDGTGLEGTGYDRAAYQLLLQGLDADGHVVGGVRQGGTPEERLDEYNLLDIRSIILPYDAKDYDHVAGGLVALRKLWELETNAEAVARLVEEAMEQLDIAPPEFVPEP
jgi:hypothetical protein